MVSKELQKLWAEHLAASVPSGLPDEIDGEDLLLAVFAGCIAVAKVVGDREHYAASGVRWWQLRRRWMYARHTPRILRNTSELFAKTSNLDPESRVYLGRLKRLADLALAERGG